MTQIYVIRDKSTNEIITWFYTREAAEKYVKRYNEQYEITIELK